MLHLFLVLFDILLLVRSTIMFAMHSNSTAVGAHVQLVIYCYQVLFRAYLDCHVLFQMVCSNWPNLSENDGDCETTLELCRMFGLAFDGLL